MSVSKLKVTTTANEQEEITVIVQTTVEKDEELTNTTINEGPLLLTRISTLVEFNAITSLILRGCSLKELKADLRRLDLKQLDLSKNQLTTIPACLYAGLKNLETLNVSYNSITLFNTPPACFKALTRIDASENCFKELPAWVFAKGCALLELSYSNNPQICAMHGDKDKPLNSSLKRLEIANCQIVEKDFDYLRSFGVLEHLDLSNGGKYFHNNINATDGLFGLLNLQAYLKVMVLNRLGIHELPCSVKHFQRLEELHVEFNDLNALPEELLFAERLRVLKVGNNQLYKLPAYLNKMKRLEIIAAEFNYIAKVDLSNMPRLRSVDLYHNEISEIRIDKTIPLIDLDLNYVANADELCDNYTRKRDTLREENNKRLRSTGCIVENATDRSSCTSSEGSSCEIHSIDKNIAGVEVEDENWDDFYAKDLGEMTLSDSEYQGEFASKCNSVSPSFVNDSVYDYLYEDAD